MSYMAAVARKTLGASLVKRLKRFESLCIAGRSEDIAGDNAIGRSFRNWKYATIGLFLLLGGSSLTWPRRSRGFFPLWSGRR